MKNDTDLPQSVTILEHVQKPTKQRFFVLGILFVSLSIIYLDRVNISIIAANTHFLNEMHLNDKPIRYLLRYRRLLNATTLCVYPLAINGSCRSDVVCSGGFKWYGRWFRGIITCINWFYIECYS